MNEQSRGSKEIYPAARAREHAFHQLNRIEQQGAFVSFVSDLETSVARDDREERQATDYVAGVTRWRRWLDFIASHFYRGNYEKMEPALRQILRLGLYDILLLKTPPHAAVNEAVMLAKKLVRPQAGGLVNGILRSVLRHWDQLPIPATGDPAEDLAIEGSHPTWMVRRWLEQYGAEGTKSLIAWNNTRPYYSLRINPIKTTKGEVVEYLRDLGVDCEESPYLEDFIRVRQLHAIFRSPLIEEGWCAIQDESAALIVRILDVHPGEILIDGCAAPGGKAIYAAQQMQNQGNVYAVDLHEHRLGLIRESAVSHGINIIKYRRGDFREIVHSEKIPPGDKVLIDAPCSGFGVLSKRADLRWNKSPSEIKELAELQDQLLDAAAHILKTGGILVYSTCTITPEENQQRIAAFLQRNPEFVVDSVKGLVPEVMVTPEGYFASLPHRDGIDGTFAARMRKT